MIIPRIQLGMWPSAGGRCRLINDGSTRVSCLRPARATVASTPRELLESFWEARGVLDPLHRKRLVDAAVEQLQAGQGARAQSTSTAWVDRVFGLQQGPTILSAGHI